MQDNTIEVVSPPALDIVYYFNELANYLSAHSPSILSGLFSSGSVLIGYLVGLSIVISVVLIIGIVYSVERLKHIRKLEDKIYNAKVDPGYETIEKNFSQAFQDLFVLTMLNGKKNGIFIEIGAYNGQEISNTFLLEKK